MSRPMKGSNLKKEKQILLRLTVEVQNWLSCLISRANFKELLVYKRVMKTGGIIKLAKRIINIV